MIQAFDYYYRRRYLDGTSGVVSNSGSVLMRRDDTEATVLDFRFQLPRRIGPYNGRRGAHMVTIATEKVTIYAARLWLWWDRPMRLYQFYDETGALAVYRIDFATLPHRQEHACYQTDLYLDLFVSAEGNEYAILDEDEVEIALALGLLNEPLKAQIVTQCNTLINLVESGQFACWLAAHCSHIFDLTALPAGWGWQHREVANGQPDGWPV